MASSIGCHWCEGPLVRGAELTPVEVGVLMEEWAFNLLGLVRLERKAQPPNKTTQSFMVKKKPSLSARV
jgi:hypothetical protein